MPILRPAIVPLTSSPVAPPVRSLRHRKQLSLITFAEASTKVTCSPVSDWSADRFAVRSGRLSSPIESLDRV